MVFVKVRETYDLHTVTGKMTMIGIHTPKAQIIKDNYPGLLMQCKAYRPVSCDVNIACASMLPVDPAGVGTETGDIAPEDLFNPILYKACSNIGMSQIEARILTMGTSDLASADVNGSSAFVDNDSVSVQNDEFNLYYGLLADTNQWRHASPQSGLSMTGLRPLVYEMLFTSPDNQSEKNTNLNYAAGFTGVQSNGNGIFTASYAFRGNPKPMPMLNCTSYSFDGSGGSSKPGFDGSVASNSEEVVPAPPVYVGCIIVPPSRLHQLYYRMVVEWTLEFSSIRSMHEITGFGGLANLGANSHYQTYAYAAAKAAAGIESGVVDTNDTSMVSSNVDINKVM